MSCTAWTSPDRVCGLLLIPVLLAGLACSSKSSASTAPGETPRSGAGSCGLSQTAETSPVEFLDGRVRVELPHGFEVQAAAATNLMAAPTSLQRRSAVIGPIPGEKAELLLIGFELFATRPTNMDDYLEHVGAFIGQQGPMLAVDIEGQPDFWAFRPEVFTEVEGTTTVTATLLDLGDGLMVFVGLGIIGDTAGIDLEACADLAAKTLASATAGSRRPDWGEADHTVPTPDGQTLTVRRPAGWGAYTNIMYDHSVTYFMELLPLWSEELPASVTIYVGHHADPRTPENSKVHARTIAGRTVDWYRSQDGESTLGMGRVEGILGHDEVQIHTRTTNPTNTAATDGLVDSLRVGE